MLGGYLKYLVRTKAATRTNGSLPVRTLTAWKSKIITFEITFWVEGFLVSEHRPCLLWVSPIATARQSNIDGGTFWILSCYHGVAIQGNPVRLVQLLLLEQKVDSGPSQNHVNVTDNKVPFGCVQWPSFPERIIIARLCYHVAIVGAHSHAEPRKKKQKRETNNHQPTKPKRRNWPEKTMPIRDSLHNSRQAGWTANPMPWESPSKRLTEISSPGQKLLNN